MDDDKAYQRERLTWEETKTCSGPTIAKKPIYQGISNEEVAG